MGAVAGGGFARSAGWGGYGGGWEGYGWPGYAWSGYGWPGYGWGGYGWPGYGWGLGVAGLALGLGLASAYSAYPPVAFVYPYHASPFYWAPYPLYGWGGYGWGGYGCCGWGGYDWGWGLAGLAFGLGLTSAFSYPLYGSPFYGAPYPLYGYDVPLAYAPPPYVYGVGPVYGYGYESVAYDYAPVTAVSYGVPLW
ncbi:MAG: hypothetical protein ACR65X_16365 [Methylocystis sp.]